MSLFGNFKWKGVIRLRLIMFDGKKSGKDEISEDIGVESGVGEDEEVYEEIKRGVREKEGSCSGTVVCEG